MKRQVERLADRFCSKLMAALAWAEITTCKLMIKKQLHSKVVFPLHFQNYTIPRKMPKYMRKSFRISALSKVKTSLADFY